MNECTKVKTSKTLLSISREKNFKQFLHLLDVWQKNLCFKVISQDNGRVLFQIPIIHYHLQFVGFFSLFWTNYFVHVWSHFRWKFTRKRWVKVKLLSCLNKDDLASKKLVNNLVYLQVNKMKKSWKIVLGLPFLNKPEINFQSLDLEKKALTH